MVCKSSLFLSWWLHKNIKGKIRIYVTKRLNEYSPSFGFIGLNKLIRKIHGIYNTCTVHIYALIHFVSYAVCLSGSEYAHAILSLVYICISVGEPIIKRGWDPVNWFNPATFLWLYQTRTLISKSYTVIVEETEVPAENHWSDVSRWQTLSHNVIHLALIEIRPHNINGDKTYCIILYDMTYAYHSQTFQFHTAIVLPNISVKGYV
jgi:hypothetical protein